MTEYHTDMNIKVDTLFWKHRSPFLGTQEQLDELKADVDRRAAARAHAELARYVHAAAPRPSIYDKHRPATRRLTPIVHVGFVPMLWAITTCACGDRWPCHKVKRHLRDKLGWTIDITDNLKTITRRLPKPRLRLFGRRRVPT